MGKNVADLVNKTVPFAIFSPNNISFNIVAIITAHLLILLFRLVHSPMLYPFKTFPQAAIHKHACDTQCQVLTLAPLSPGAPGSPGKPG